MNEHEMRQETCRIFCPAFQLKHVQHHQKYCIFLVFLQAVLIFGGNLFSGSSLAWFACCGAAINCEMCHQTNKRNKVEFHHLFCL